jgi:RNA polymerase sigma-70 factor (ECF subfamily)
MAERTLQGAAEIFDPLRPRLMRVAYRMLGSVSDAEDVVQEAFIRWMGVDREGIRDREAFLRRGSHGFVSISLNLQRANVKRISAPGFPIRSLRTKEGKTSHSR